MTKRIVIHVGFHKTGTTWLQENYFNKSPDLNYIGKMEDCRVPGILDFFHYMYETGDIEFSPEHARKLFEISISKSDFDNSSEDRPMVLSDEGFSGGYDWFGGCVTLVADRLRDVFFDCECKIIIGIRNQESMILSIYSEYIKRGGTKSLERLIFSPYSEGRFILNRLQYDGFVSKYFAVFGNKNVFVYSFEDFVKAPNSVCVELSAFICPNLPPFVPKYVVENSRNKSPSPLALSLMRFSNTFFYSINNQTGVIVFIAPLFAFPCYLLCFLFLTGRKEKIFEVSFRGKYLEFERFFWNRLLNFSHLMLSSLDKHVLCHLSLAAPKTKIRSFIKDY
jgi:hypothetical protein